MFSFIVAFVNRGHFRYLAHLLGAAGFAPQVRFPEAMPGAVTGGLSKSFA
ncbi:MAG: hypothetical protein AB1556_02445 [Bacillota bacterium]